MVKTHFNKSKGLVVWITLIALCAMPLSLVAQQTEIKYHSNKYSAQDDVKLGRQAAQEAEQQFPILRDEDTRRYVERVGQRLVSAIPNQFQHPEFQYYFKVVNASDINAFALPGGPMYVNRGMIEAARSEGEMAGVMAHERRFETWHSPGDQAAEVRSAGRDCWHCRNYSRGPWSWTTGSGSICGLLP